MKKFCDINWAILQIVHYSEMYQNFMTRGYFYQISEGAFIGGRKTKATGLLDFMSQLTLIQIDENEQIRLQQRGNDLAIRGSESHYDLSEEQKTLVASWYLPMQKSVSSNWLSYFRQDLIGTYTCHRTSIPRELQQWTEEMLYLNVSYQEGEIIKLKSADRWVFSGKFTDNPMTSKELLEQLKLQEENGRIAEQIVFEYEISRLIELSLFDESSKVELISDEFVNAGYDILSFSSENPIPNLFIEVKSVGGDLQFYWSSHEQEVAKTIGDQYFLYLVERANSEPVIWMIQNPFERLVLLGAKIKTLQSQVSFAKNVKNQFKPNTHGQLPGYILR